MITAALTGNIGMGKSVVLDMFRGLGAFTLSSDEIVSELLGDESVLSRIRELLGPGAFDPEGLLDRKKVAGIIFNDEDMRKKYEAIIHPLVYEQIRQRVAASGAEVAVVEVPVLFESGGAGMFDKTITVYTNVNTALDRLEIGGMDRQAAVERLMCQMPIAEKVSQSSYSVDNNSGSNITSSQVRRIYRVLQFHASEKAGA